MIPLLGAVLAHPTLPPLEWTIVNDTVMGGASTGVLTAPNGIEVQFRGELSLEQNGGFVSIRSRPRDLQLGGATGIDVVVRGEGRTWSINAYRQDVPLRAGSYRLAIPTASEGLTRVRVLFEAFQPTSFGRPVQGAPALDGATEAITSIGFLLADKQPGPFSLDVVSIQPIGKARPRGPGHADVLGTLRRSLVIGVPRFNAGDVTGCRDAYREALTLITESEALTNGERYLVRWALHEAKEEPPRQSAWTLRNAIDSLLADG